MMKSMSLAIIYSYVFEIFITGREIIALYIVRKVVIRCNRMYVYFPNNENCLPHIPIFVETHRKTGQTVPAVGFDIQIDKPL